MFSRWRKQRQCFHHEIGDYDRTALKSKDNYARIGKSFIKSKLIDVGARKLEWCTECDKTWIS